MENIFSISPARSSVTIFTELSRLSERSCDTPYAYNEPLSIFTIVKVVVVMENVINLQGIVLQPLRGLTSVQALPDFTQFQVTYLQSSAFFKKYKIWNNNISENHIKFFARENESVRRQKLRKNTAGR
jgi:hypothetical protein